MENLRNLPALSVYTAKEGTARASIERQGDTLIVTAECDSLRQLLYERDTEINYKNNRIEALEREVKPGYSLLHLIGTAAATLLAGLLMGWIAGKLK